jgi:hypothetical protein
MDLDADGGGRYLYSERPWSKWQYEWAKEMLKPISLGGSKVISLAFPFLPSELAFGVKLLPDLLDASGHLHVVTTCSEIC